MKSSKTKLSEIKIKEKIVIIHKMGLYMGERIEISGPIAKTKRSIDVKKNVQYEYKLFVFLNVIMNSLKIKFLKSLI